MHYFNVDAFIGYLSNWFLIGGVGVTVALTVAGVIGGLVLGMGIALLKVADARPLNWIAGFYIWLFRGTPLLVQLVVIYTGLPQLGIKLGAVESALLGLVLHEAAYLAEIIRSGFLSVPVGQREAAWALSLGRGTAFWRVILPQAFRLMIPPLGNSINGLLKATSLASVISVEELMRRSEMLMQEQFLTLEVYAAAAVYYLVLTTLWDLIQRPLEKHFGRSIKKGGR
ncbi:amino acid ABC transporter permease [Xanthobacter dioxanivorans]|uniref:Glutamate/aspartate import permease protein GltK n=1 Tax=Xanthobacter dioxanivorans TaxID=2528964 RepID=A0A974PM02_9HYPH|nr:amino acid ABC transporter permease [Xanthobacter dioxanivorans]QRG05659.1 amino acid ABC transporter permease [Xanthobacter dioxanivorans]